MTYTFSGTKDFSKGYTTESSNYLGVEVQRYGCQGVFYAVTGYTGTMWDFIMLIKTTNKFCIGYF